MYKYEAYDSKNKKVRGEISASDKSEVVIKLRERGLVPISIFDSNARTPAPKSIWEADIHFKSIYKIKISKKKLYILFNQCAMMVKAGVSLIFMLEVLIESERDKTLKQILKEMSNDLQTGMQLSETMQKFETFSDVVTSIIAAGEMNGRLDDAMARIANMLEKESVLTGKVKSALTYPIFLLSVTAVVVVLLNTVVLPTFVSIFKQFDSNLPLITRFVMGGSQLMIHYWYLFLIGIGGIFLLLYLLSASSPAYCIAKDRLLLKIPVLGNLLKKTYLARFLRIMESLVNAGVEIISSLETSQKVIRNKYIQSFITKSIELVKLGTPISESLKRYPIFEPLLVSMIRVGEESGLLPESLQKMAELYESQADEATKAFTAVLEPLMTVFIALIVGTIVISVVVPMFNMYTIIS